MQFAELSDELVACADEARGLKDLWCQEALLLFEDPTVVTAVDALVDALRREYGIDHIDMPATPLRVWEAIQEAKASA